jgi:hypothetical protein
MTQQTTKIMTVHVGLIKTLADSHIEKEVAEIEPGHFCFCSFELLHEVLNPSAIRLLSDIKRGKLNDFSLHKLELDRLLKHKIIELKDDKFVFGYDEIHFDCNIWIPYL